MIPVVFFLYVVIALWYLFGVMRRQWYLNPGPLFVLQQLVFFLGMLPLFDSSIEADNVHAAMCLGALCMFIAGNVFCQVVIPNVRTGRSFWAASVCRVETKGMFNALILLIIATSVVVSFFYYRAVGYNLFLEGLLSLVTGSSQLGDVTTRRLNSYAGGQYFAAGYVNQFKNVLFPLLLSYLLARYILIRRRRDLFLVILLSPLCLLFILGTGQRGAMFLSCVTAVLFFMSSLPRKSKRVVIVVVGAMLCATLLLSTLILGRKVSSLGSEGGAATLGMEVLDRFTSGNETAAVSGFRYIYDKPLHFGLGEWVYAFRDILPGHERRIGLASDLFKVFYGSNRGTAPASIWGGAWYEFGAAGVLGLAFVLGMSYHAIYARLCRGEKRLSRLLTYAAITQIFGTWGVGGPETLFNVGLISVLMLMMLIKISVKLDGARGFVSVWVGRRTDSRLPQIAEGASTSGSLTAALRLAKGDANASA